MKTLSRLRLADIPEALFARAVITSACRWLSSYRRAFKHRNPRLIGDRLHQGNMLRAERNRALDGRGLKLPPACHG